jgi:hypothetical protein
MNFATTIGKSLQSADSNLMLPQLVSMDTSEHSTLFPRMRLSSELKDTRQYQHHELKFQNNFIRDGNNEAVLQPIKRQKPMEYAFGVSSVNDASINQSTHEMVQPCSFERLSEAQQQLEFEEYSVEQFTNLVLDSMGVSGINNNMIVDISGQAFETDKFLSSRLEAGQISDEPDCIMIDSRNSVEIDSMPTSRKELIIIDDDDEEDIQGGTWIQEKADQENQTQSSNTTGLEAGQIPNEPDSIIYGMIDSRKSVDIDCMPTRRIELIIIDDDDDDDEEEEDIQGITGFNQEGIDAKKEFGEPKTDQENQTESSNTTVNEINNNVVDRSKSMDIDIGSNSNTHSLISKGPIPLDVEDKQDTTSFNSEGTDAKTEVSETKVDQEKQTKSSNRIDDAVSLVDLLTHDQITKHISSFGEQSNQVRIPIG